MNPRALISVVALCGLAACIPKKSDATGGDAASTDDAAVAAAADTIDAGVRADPPKASPTHANARPAKPLGSQPPTTPSAKPSAAATPPSTPPKCGANQHYDDINKKCRPYGDCPAGYDWNDPMKSCIQQ